MLRVTVNFLNRFIPIPMLFKALEIMKIAGTMDGFEGRT